MHEVALAQARTVRMQAGELQAVTQDSLQFCFEMVAQDTDAANARLEVEIVPGDALLIDAIELDDGWQFRPDASSVDEAPHAHAGTGG